MFKRIVMRGLKTGAVLSLTSTAAVMLAGLWETGSPWAGVNAISHIVDGDDISQPSEFSPRESSIGLAVNAAAMLGWAVLYEGALALAGKKSNPLTAAAASAAAYIVDYKIVPPRLRPGMEKKLSRDAIFAAYAVLAATLALSPLWNDYDENPSAETSTGR